ncbi:hypothetical protein DPEC_G00148710, partial [Dallia pectoralis]
RQWFIYLTQPFPPSTFLTSDLTCVTLSVTLCVRSLTFGAMMVFSEDWGEEHFLSLLISAKFSVMRGILLIALYLFRWESDVEPRRLDFIWLKGPGTERAVGKRVTSVMERVLGKWVEAVT